MYGTLNFDFYGLHNFFGCHFKEQAKKTWKTWDSAYKRIYFEDVGTEKLTCAENSNRTSGKHSV